MKRVGIVLSVVWAVLAASVLYGQDGASDPASGSQTSIGRPVENVVPDALDEGERASPLGTAFTYQGHLNVSGSPANAEYDMRFSLYDDLGVLVAGPICLDNVDCVGGLFTVEIDFGAQFGGDARELQIAIRPGGPLGDCAVGGYTTLSPRQKLTATPYALGLRLPYAGTASVNGYVVSITNSNVSSGTAGIRGIQSGTAPFSFIDTAGVRGESDGPVGAGVLGIGTDYAGVIGYTSGEGGLSVFGRADGANAIGVKGWGLGTGGIGVYGYGALWAGYFDGSVRLDGLQLPTGAAAGKVLTSDASGNGTWQTPGPSATFANGSGTTPTATTQFLSPYVTVTITAGQKIMVTANQTFGSTAVGGADSLDLYIGYRVAGSGATPTTLGGGMYNNRVQQNTRIPMGISGVISGLAAGSYEVGMAGDDDGNGNWNYNEWGYVSVLVLN
jgi:hypothetical protein